MAADEPAAGNDDEDDDDGRGMPALSLFVSPPPEPPAAARPAAAGAGGADAPRIRVPWADRHAPRGATDENGRLRRTARPGPQPDPEAPRETDEEGRLLPPMANPDLPSQLERDNSFMVPGSDSESDDGDAAAHLGAAVRREQEH